MIEYIAALLLIVVMIAGLYIWLEDHDDNRLRVIRLGSIIGLAAVLLFVIFIFGTKIQSGSVPLSCLLRFCS